jgi:hypothetical protein
MLNNRQQNSGRWLSGWLILDPAQKTQSRRRHLPPSLPRRITSVRSVPISTLTIHALWRRGRDGFAAYAAHPSLRSGPPALTPASPSLFYPPN